MRALTGMPDLPASGTAPLSQVIAQLVNGINDGDNFVSKGVTTGVTTGASKPHPLPKLAVRTTEVGV